MMPAPTREEINIVIEGFRREYCERMEILDGGKTLHVRLISRIAENEMDDIRRILQFWGEFLRREFAGEDIAAGKWGDFLPRCGVKRDEIGCPRRCGDENRDTEDCITCSLNDRFGRCRLRYPFPELAKDREPKLTAEMIRKNWKGEMPERIWRKLLEMYPSEPGTQAALAGMTTYEELLEGPEDSPLCAMARFDEKIPGDNENVICRKLAYSLASLC